MKRLNARRKPNEGPEMTDYFKGVERLETFPATGASMRMGEVEHLFVPDFEVLKQKIRSHLYDEASAYLNVFYAQNTGMIGLLFDWCGAQVKMYQEQTSEKQEVSLRLKAITDYQKLIDLLGVSYTKKHEKTILVQLRNYFSEENLHLVTNSEIFRDLENAYKNLMTALNEKNESAALELVDHYHAHAFLYHDGLISFIYSYPTTVMQESGESIALEVGNGSIMKNPLWSGMWELTKVLTPVDLAAFLAEHLRSHFSGAGRLGQTQIIEDDKKIRLIFDPCGSGGAIRRRLQDDIVNLKEKHQLGWNKCNEVNLYCSHCALNEKKSIDMFGYPKLVVEFQADPEKPCGWTMYKNEADVPLAVYERLGIKK